MAHKKSEEISVETMQAVSLTWNEYETRASLGRLQHGCGREQGWEPGSRVELYNRYSFFIRLFTPRTDIVGPTSEIAIPPRILSK